MFGGQARVPLVARMPIGMWRSSAAQHSQSLEAWYAHIPGLVVVCPATPADNKGLLKSAIRSDDPVVYMEHKNLGAWRARSDANCIPLGLAATLRGQRLTIVSWSARCVCGRGAARSARAGIARESRSATIFRGTARRPGPVRRTGASRRPRGGDDRRLRRRNRGDRREGFDRLKAPVRRLGAPRIPVPYSPPLEELCKIAPDRIVEIARAMLSYR